MTSAVSTIFNRPLLGGAERKTDTRKAAQGFTAIFSTMLAKEMRKALVGEDKGPAGIDGGASGEIYGAFFDQAMGKALARSAAMKPLNRLVFRQLGGAGKAAQAAPSASRTRVGRTLKASAGACGSPETASGTSGSCATLRAIDFDPSDILPSDDLGPVLLPQPPASVAPILPAPSPLGS